MGSCRAGVRQRPGVICSAESRQTVVAASEREQEGEQGRQIAREGDRAKGKKKRKKKGRDTDVWEGDRRKERRGKKKKVQLHLGSKTGEKNE